MSRPDATSAAPPAPRFAMGWAALVYALCALALGHSALVGEFLVNSHSDQYIAGYAFREFAAQSLRQGAGFPLWNPYQFGGMPYVAAMHGDIFYPTFLLRMLMPTDVAMTWSFILHVFLAGLFTYGFLRATGFGFWGALVAGVAYSVGGNVAGLVSPGHDGKLYLAALLPLTLWLVHSGMRGGRNWAWGALAVVIGLDVLTPHPQLLQYLLLVAGAYALFLAFSAGEHGERLPRAVALRRLACAAGAVAIGGLIGAIQYLPVMEYVPWSPRSGGKGWEHAVSYSLPLEEMFNFYLPHFSGILENYWGRNGIHFHSEYIGAVVLMLAALAFGAWPSAFRRRTVLFWAGTFVIALLWALGGSTPFYHLVYAIVPGTKFFRAPSTMLYVVSFAVAVLVAAGTERALAGRVGRNYAFGWIGAALLVALLASAGGLTNLAASLAMPERIDAARANGPAIVGGAWRSFVFILAAAVLLLLSRSRGYARFVAPALVLVVAVDLWSVERLYWRFSPPAATTYASDETIEYLKRETEPFRVIALELEPSPVREPYIGVPGTSNLMIHGIRQVLGYHGNELGRYDVLTGKDQGYNQVANPNLWQLLNTRFFLTNVDSLPIPGATRVAGPARNAAGTTAYLFRLPGDNPFAWVAPVIVKAGDEATAGTVLDPRFDVRRAAIFDSSSQVQGKTIQALPEPTNIAVHVSRFEPGRISMELASPAPAGSALIASENYYPGWRAQVDGRPAVIARADLTLIGVELPAGARRVELSFESVTYERGKWLTLGALLLAISWCAGGLVVDRRARG